MKVKIALAVLMISGVLLSGCPKPVAPQPPDGSDSIDLPPVVQSIADVSSLPLSEFYAAFADVLERDADKGLVKTTGHLQRAYTTAGQLLFQNTTLNDELSAKHPDLPKEIDEILAAEIGLDDVLLTPERRTRAIACFRAIAEALK